MPVYLVGFDVRNGNAADDYSGLQKAIAKLEKHRLMPWLYLVSVPFTPSALKDYLLNNMNAKDCVWVSKLHPKAKLEFAYQTAGGTSAWLKKHGRVELPEPPSDGKRAPSYRRADIANLNSANGVEAGYA
jgi:hypothetical protein